MTSADRVVVVGDAHLGPSNRADEPAFHELLEAVPDLGTRLILMGDLFEFWFGYRRAIPRDTFRTMARIERVVSRGVAAEMFGGNHDRWGDSFWAEDLGIPFHDRGADLELAGRAAWVHHGDGLAEAGIGGKIMHGVTRSPITTAVFRALHPDFGIRLVDRLATVLSETNKTAEAMDASAAMQERYARQVLDRRPELSLVLLAHTHRQRLVEHAPGRFYLNAGQWMAERHYAVISRDAIWTGAWPARPA